MIANFTTGGTSKNLKRSLDQWLADYAVSHQPPINKKIHWLCV